MTNISKEDSDDFLKINLFLNNGIYDKGINLIKKNIEKTDISKEKRIKYKTYYCKFLNDYGQFKHALSIINKLIKNSFVLDNKLCLVDIFLIELKVFNNLSKYEEGLREIIKIEEILKNITGKSSLKIKKRLGSLYEIKGILLGNSGKLKSAFEYFSKSFKIREEINNKKDLGSIYHYLGWYHGLKSEVNKALKYFNQALTLREEIGNKKDIANSYHEIGWVYAQKGELDQAKLFSEKSLELRKNLGNNLDLAWSYHTFGWILSLQGDYERALTFINKGLDLRKGLENKLDLAWSYHEIAWISSTIGQLDFAFKNAKLSLKLRLDIGNTQDIAWSYACLAKIYYQKGELDQAIEYANKSHKLFIEVGNKADIAYSYQIIAQIHYQNGNIESTLNYLEQSLALRKEIYSTLHISHNLFLLIYISLEINDMQRAKQYFNDLEELNINQHNKLVNHRYRVSKALIFKNENRRKLLTKAEEILEELIEESILNNELKIIAIINLSELKFEEFDLYKEPQILNEINILVDELLEIGEKQGSYWLVTEGLQLKFRLSVLTHDYSKARKLLSQAQSTANNKKLKRLKISLLKEKDRLKENIDKKNQLMNKYRIAIDEIFKRVKSKTQITQLSSEKYEIGQDNISKYIRYVKDLENSLYNLKMFGEQYYSMLRNYIGNDLQKIVNELESHIMNKSLNRNLVQGIINTALKSAQSIDSISKIFEILHKPKDKKFSLFNLSKILEEIITPSISDKFIDIIIKQETINFKIYGDESLKEGFSELLLYMSKSKNNYIKITGSIINNRYNIAINDFNSPLIPRNVCDIVKEEVSINSALPSQFIDLLLLATIIQYNNGSITIIPNDQKGNSFNITFPILE
ncbi:MAG: tetratricopeptide repeat protein [Candidatus Lokiarchaeota archaeon]|nr:tetratricopeptide repeat protein [Candidatus Lokiarchaeota archaeon]